MGYVPNNSVAYDIAVNKRLASWSSYPTRDRIPV